MSDEDFYNSREHFIPKSDRSEINKIQFKSGTLRAERIRRTKNSGLRRLYHLARKDSGRKLVIGIFILIPILLLLFSWIYRD